MVAPTRAQNVESAGCSSARLLSGVPAGCEAVVVVNDAARQRTSSAGVALGSMISESGLLPDTARAWRELAEVLDWSCERAFDELLGRKCTVVVRSLSGDGPADWAILTEVSAEADKRLRLRLRAAPRGTIAGLAVLAVEDGKYELAMGRGSPIDPGLLPEGTAPTVTVLLAPGGGTPLFSELAPSLVTRTGLASPSAVWRVGQKERDCDVVVMLRERDPAAEHGWRSLSLTASLENHGWDARAVCAPEFLGDRSADLAAIKPWSDAPLRVLERDALAAVMSVTGTARMQEAGVMGGLVRLLPRVPLPVVGDIPGRLSATVVHASDAGRRAEPAVRREANADAVAVGGSRMVGIGPTLGSSPVSSGSIAVTVAVQALDSEQLRRDGDLGVARFLAWLQSGEEPSQGLSASLVELGDEVGGFRTLAIESVVEPEPDMKQRLGRFFGGEPCLMWGVRRGAGREVAGTSSVRTGSPQTWWAASLSPCGAGTAERDAVALSWPAPATTVRRLSTGVVRPGAIYRRLGGDGMEALNLPRSLRRVESVRWDSWVRADGNIEGTLSLRIEP